MHRPYVILATVAAVTISVFTFSGLFGSETRENEVRYAAVKLEASPFLFGYETQKTGMPPYALDSSPSKSQSISGVKAAIYNKNVISSIHASSNVKSDEALHGFVTDIDITYKPVNGNGRSQALQTMWAKSKTTVEEGPGSKYENTGTISAESKVYVYEKSGDWSRIGTARWG